MALLGVSSPATMPVSPQVTIVSLAKDYEGVLEQRNDDSGFVSASPTDIQSFEEAMDRLEAKVNRISTSSLDTTKTALYMALKWELKTRRDLRVCRSYLWDVDHINGWQAVAPQRFARLRVDDPLAEAASQASAMALARHVDVDIESLRHGLSEGYSAPKTVVLRVVAELDAVLNLTDESSPLFQPAREAHDRAAADRWRQTVEQITFPAIRRYRTFLATEYLPRARSSLSLSSLPDGAACYAARLRRETTLDWSAADAYALGKRTVAEARHELAEIGRRQFHLSDPDLVLRRAKESPANRFESPEALLSFLKQDLQRTVLMSAPLFRKLPDQAVEIEPLPAFQANAGVPSHYVPQSADAIPAKFVASLSDWANETVGAAQVTTSHETVPGHHMQIATERELQGERQFSDVGYNSAYVEGWANYAERLAEEAHVYTGEDAKIFRRVILGRSLVLDPGIHAFGWSRTRALRYMLIAGLSRKAAEDTLDRIAVEPAQLTAYESGGLEIYRLREEAKKRLGPAFNLKSFHQRVLERGVVTLQSLKEYLDDWNGD